LDSEDAAVVQQPVAVKLFKGAVTSDGLPHCEMTACIHAGGHRHLIPVLGRVVHHPSGVNGLVMELIETEFVNLAGPPSLDSCTRDVYAPNQEFGASVLLGIARGMASAAQHLHAQGLMHGDLYAHNILHNAKGMALLGDFGAASFYASEDAALADALQRIEVRAFACLLEELLARSPELSGESDLYQGLAQLRNQCFADDGATRPLFHEIEQTLRDLMPD
jgi:serine/threonine protein kinase